MNQQKHLLPILIGIFMVLIFGFKHDETSNPESVHADANVASFEEFEFSIDSSGELVTGAKTPVAEFTDEVPESFQLYEDPDCQEQTIWTGEEVVDPFSDSDNEFDFWDETVEFHFEDLETSEVDLVTVNVSVQETVEDTEYPQLSDEGVEFIADFFEQASETDEVVPELEEVPSSDFSSDPSVEVGTSVEDDVDEESQQQLLEQIPVADELAVSERTPVFDEISVIEEFDVDGDFSDLVEQSVEAARIDTALETTIAEFLSEPVETLEELDEIEEVVFEVPAEIVGFSEEVLEVVESTPPSLESRSALSLQQEELRVADLRRFSSDDIHRSNWTRALDQLRELVALRPYLADYHITLGLVHRNLEDQFGDGAHLQEAMRKYEEYSAFGGEEAIASLLLAEAHAASGDRTTAFEFLERAASHGMNIARAVQQFPVLEKFTRDTRFVRSSLRLERYTLSSVMTRDPFTGPWSRSGNQNKTVFIGPFSMGQQLKALADAREAMSRVEYALRNRDESTAMEAYGVIENIGNTIARFDQPELAGELRSIMERLDEVEEGIERIRVTYLYEQARSKMESMKKAFEDQDFTIVDRLHGEVSSLAFSIEEMGESYTTASTLVVQAADQLQQRSDIVREFLANNVSVEGVVVSPDGSHAIIDGRWVPEGGDVFDGRLDLILRDRIVILYKGERITHRFSRF
ncbi:MAG: hypothetical protein VX404_08305 [Planctomycetota bacterium]|nr:hypothetical protein [Planctomycetota bacterium]